MENQNFNKLKIGNLIYFRLHEDKPERLGLIYEMEYVYHGENLQKQLYRVSAIDNGENLTVYDDQVGYVPLSEDTLTSLGFEKITQNLFKKGALTVVFNEPTVEKTHPNLIVKKNGASLIESSGAQSNEKFYAVHEVQNFTGEQIV